MEEIILKVSGVSKLYNRHYLEKKDLKTAIGNGINSFFTGQSRKGESEIWALKDISFEVKKGDTIGIIGKNGAGKSTLLKILSEITSPTTGQIEINGKVASILDIGTGFMPELTGRENIFLSGKIIGISKRELEQHVDEIIDFSGIREFVDTPVKYYSSGMYVRLAFSIIAHVNADILLFDEIMGVGDTAFQQKSYNKIQELVDEGRTIITTSHNLSKIAKLCSKIMLLDNGEIKASGNTGDILNEYMKDSILFNYSKSDNAEPRKSHEVSWTFDNAPGNDYVKLNRILVRGHDKLPGEPIFPIDPLTIEVYLWKLNHTSNIDIIFLLSHLESLVLASSTIGDENVEISDDGLFKASINIPENLLNSTIYTIDIRMILDQSSQIFNATNILSFSIEDVSGEPDEKDRFNKAFPSAIKLPLVWTVEKIDK